MSEKSLILKKNDVLIEEGKIDNNLYWLQKGALQVIVKRGDEDIIIGEISEGELVGELSFMDGKARSATVKALKDSQLVKIPVENVNEIIEKQPKWFQILVRTGIERLRKTNTKVKNLI